MPIEDVEEGLRELGFDPHQPLPDALRRIRDRGGRAPLNSIARRKLFGEKFYRRLTKFFSLDFLSPAHLSVRGLFRKVSAGYRLAFATLFLVLAILSGDLVEHSSRRHVGSPREKVITRSEPLTLPLFPEGAPPGISPPAERYMAAAARGFITAAGHEALPAGTLVRLETGSDSGEYIVASASTEVRRPHATAKKPVKVAARAVPLQLELQKMREELEALITIRSERLWAVDESKLKALTEDLKEVQTALSNAMPERDEQFAEWLALQKELDAASPPPAEPPVSFMATAYSLRGHTDSGRPLNREIIATDRHVFPTGTRVRLDAGSYSGEYVVADTGGAVRGRKIDIWMPSTGEAMRFGRRTVKLTVLTRVKPRAASAKPRKR